VPDDVIRAMAARQFGRPVPGAPAAAPAAPPPQPGKKPVQVRPIGPPPDAPVRGPQFEQDRPYIDRGMWDFDVLASVLVPHNSPGDASGFVSLGLGRYVASNSAIGMFTSGTFGP